MRACRSGRVSTSRSSSPADGLPLDQVGRRGDGRVEHQVAEHQPAVVADGRVEGHRVPADPAQVGDPVGRQPGRLGQLGDGGVPPQPLVELALGPDDLGQLLQDVHRQPHHPRLLGHPAADGLPDPPGGVGRELVALGPVELLHRTDQAEVALLDDVEQRQPAPAVLLGDGHDQAQVGLQHVLLGGSTVGGHERQVGGVVVGQGGRVGLGSAQQLGGVHAGLDAARDLDLLRRGEQRGPADRVEVGPDRVGSGDDDLVEVGLDSPAVGGTHGDPTPFGVSGRIDAWYNHGGPAVLPHRSGLRG